MRYWAHEIAGAMVLLLVVSMLAFGAMNVLGDPLFNILGPTAGRRDNPESLVKIEAAKEEYNLDEPLPVRYAIWLGGFVQGDFGVQFSEDGRPPVSDLIVERIPRTLSLLVMAQTMAVVMAVPWALLVGVESKLEDRQGVHGRGVLADLRPELRVGDHRLVLPRDQVRLVPAACTRRAIRCPHGSTNSCCRRSTLALPAAAVYQRLLRTDLITTLQEDFILTAQGQGSVAPSVLLKHALRPSLFSFVTVFALTTGALDRWRARHREHLPHPRSRSGPVRSRAPRGLPGRAGDRDDRLCGVHHRQPRRRTGVLLDRSTGQEVARCPT